MRAGPEALNNRAMIRFSQRLQEVLASARWTQKEFARQAAVSATNVSRWIAARSLPDREVLGRIIEIVPENLAPDLVAAWVSDSLPANAEGMVKIVSKHPTSKVEKRADDEWPGDLNPATRRKFVDFSRLAMRHPDVMEIVNVLHAAATRMSAGRGRSG